MDVTESVRLVAFRRGSEPAHRDAASAPLPASRDWWLRRLTSRPPVSGVSETFDLGKHFR